MQDTEVKITGDSSEAIAALEDVGKAAEDTQAKLENTGRKGAEAGGKATGGWKDGLNLFKDLLPRNLQMLQRRFESTSRQVGRMGGSFKILGAAIKAVPIFLIIEGFRWLIDNWEKVSDFLTGTTEGMKAMKTAAKEASSAENQFTNSTQFLAQSLLDTNASIDERNQALKELQKLMPELQGMTLEQATAEGVLTQALKERMVLEGQMAEMRSLQQALEDAQTKKRDAQKAYDEYSRLAIFSRAIEQGKLNEALEDETMILERLEVLNRGVLQQEGELAREAQERADALKAQQEAQRKADEAARKAAQDAKARAELNRKLDREITLAKIADDRERAKKELEYALTDEIEKAKTINSSEATINKIREKYRLELQDMRAKWAEEDASEAQRETDLRNAFWADYMERENEMFQTERQQAEARIMAEMAEQKARIDTLGLSQEAANEAKKLIEEQYLIELARLRDKYIQDDLAAEKEATDAFNALFLTDKEKRLADVEAEYQKQLAVATEYGLDIVKLEEWKAKRIAEIEADTVRESEENADKRFQAIQGFASEVSGIFGQLADLSEEGSKRQRKLAIAEVLLSQAQAMASAVRGAAQAAASTGPGAPFVLAGYIASMLGTILATFGSIKRIIGAPQGSDDPPTANRPIQQALIPNVAPAANPQLNIGPVQAYVVESQMQAQLNMTAGIARRARL